MFLVSIIDKTQSTKDDKHDLEKDGHFFLKKKVRKQYSFSFHKFVCEKDNNSFPPSLLLMLNNWKIFLFNQIATLSMAATF